MRAMLAALVTVFAFVVAQAPAGAAVYTGQVDDPQDVTGVDPYTGQPLPDLRRLTVTYDQSAGTLQIGVDLWNPPSGRPFLVDASLGVPGPGGCVSGQEDVGFHLDNDYLETSVGFRPSTGPSGLLWGSLQRPEDGAHLQSAFGPDTRLVGLGLRCIRGIRLNSWEALDDVGPFCLGTAACFAPGPTGNLVRNPSFEVGTAGWASFNGDVSRMAAPFDGYGGGAYVAHVARRTGANYSLTDNAGTASPTVASTTAGATYIATASVRAASSTAVGKPVKITLRERTGSAWPELPTTPDSAI